MKLCILLHPVLEGNIFLIVVQFECRKIIFVKLFNKLLFGNALSRAFIYTNSGWKIGAKQLSRGFYLKVERMKRILYFSLHETYSKQLLFNTSSILINF